jgi:DNA-binding transcriptional LysR family regulator
VLSLTLRQIEYAVAVARHGGMSAAAGRLHVSQPALSVALQGLEAGLGQALFLRRPGGRLTPSPFGHRWLARAEATLAQIGQLADPARLEDETLRLAVFEDLAASCLAPLLALATAEAPGLHLLPRLMGFEDLSLALSEGRADMALTWDLGLEGHIARQVVARIPPHAVLSPDHPLAAQDSLRLADLADQPLILTDQGLSVGHMRGLFARAGLSPQIAHRTATLDLMRSFAANGLGVGLSYTNPAARLSQDGQPLVTRRISDAGAEPLVLAHLLAHPPAPAMAKLAALMPQVLGGSAFPDRA